MEVAIAGGHGKIARRLVRRLTARGDRVRGLIRAGSGPERKWSMDRDGAIKLLQAAQSADVPRYLIASSVGAITS